MMSRSVKIVYIGTLFFFSANLLFAPCCVAELSCWNDGALSSANGGVSGATGLKKGDINKKNNTKVADPVDVSNGSYYYEKQDIFIPSRGLPLEIKRKYNSLDIYEGPFGVGWSHNYNIFLVSVSDGSQVCVIRRNADGSKDKFLNVDGSYTASGGCYDTLVKDAAGYIIQDMHGLKYRFDLNGKLQAITDRNLNQISFEYDEVTGVLKQAADSLGRFITFNYNPSHKVTSITDFSGRIIRYAYDINGNLINLISSPTEDYPDGNTTTYTYDDQHKLTSITDARGQKYVSIVYDDNAKVSHLYYGEGLHSFYYQPNLTTVIDPKGIQTDYQLNVDGTVNITKLYNRYTTLQTYQTSYVYNENRERVKIVYPKGNWNKFAYDDKGNLLELRKKKISAPDINDQLNDIVTQFTYESRYNFIKTMTDPRGNITTYYYDYEESDLGDLNGDGIINQGKGNLVKISYPEVSGQAPSVKYLYNSYGQVLTATDPNGNITKYEYDPAVGYLVKITKGFGSSSACVIEMTYDPVGNVATIKDGRENTTTFECDSHNNLIRTTAASPFNYITKCKYDANDNLIQLDKETSDPANPWQTTYYTYDDLDRREMVKDSLNNITRFEYDANGNRILVKDAELNSAAYAYTESNLLWKAIDALGNVTEYSYDENGNLSEIKDANGNITNYTYDDFDRLIETSYPDGTAESYTYDNSGNTVAKATRKNDIISYAYDALNRVTQKTTPETLAAYTYDTGSRIMRVTGSGGTISYTYDALDRIKTVSYPSNKVVTYDYDGNGSRTKLTYPDASYITYGYDALNRLTDIKDSNNQVICYYAYDALSRRIGKTLLNGTSTSYKYDIIDRLIDIQALPSQGGALGYAYTYDNVGNRKTMTTQHGVHTYDYDNTYQLESAAYPVNYTFVNTMLRYDSVGNRTSVVSDGTLNYVSNSMNEYTQAGAATPTYDLNGNLKCIATNTYSYDSENRLVSSLRGGAGGTDEAIYTYDPFSRRISKTVNGTITKFLYDGDQIIAEYDGSDNLVAKYINGASIDETVRMDRGTNSYYYHYDGLGSVTNLTDSTGATVESYTYDVFGKPSTTSSVGNAKMFTGRDYDQETGLYYYRARYYSAELGRFLQTDPMGYAVGANLYTYCLNNAVNATDPLGLVTVIVHGMGNHQEGYSGGIGSSLEAAGEQVIEVNWSGNILNKDVYAVVANKIVEAQQIAQARGESLNVIGHSWGTVVAGEVLHATGIKADNLISLGSPYADYSGIAKNWTNFWSPTDPISWGSAMRGMFNPEQYDVYWGIPHLNYWNHPGVIKKILEKLGKCKK